MNEVEEKVEEVNQKLIDDQLDKFFAPEIGVEPPPKGDDIEMPAETPPIEEPKDEEPAVDDKKVEGDVKPPEGEVKVDDEKVDDKKEEDVKVDDKKVEDVQAEDKKEGGVEPYIKTIEKLSSELAPFIDTRSVVVKDKKEGEKSAEKEVDELQITRDELVEAQSDPEALLKLMEKMEKRGERNVERRFNEQVPGIVHQNLDNREAVQAVAEQFYGDNRDLIPLAGLVTVEMKKIARDEPEATVEDRLNRAGEQVRAMLNLVKKAVGDNKADEEKVKRDDANSNFAPGGGGSRHIVPGSGDNKSAGDLIADEIEKMLNT